MGQDFLQGRGRGLTVRFLGLAALLIPTAQAAMDVNLAESFNQIGKWIAEIFQNEYATFGIVIVILTILLRSIFAAGLKRVKVFEGEGGTGIGSFGNAIAWSLALLSSIGLFYLKGNRDIGTFLNNVLGPGAIWGAVVCAVLLFVWLKEATGGAKWALFLTGLILMVVAKQVSFPAFATAGAVMVIIGFFWLIGSVARSGRGLSRRETQDLAQREVNLGERMSRTADSVAQTAAETASAQRTIAQQEDHIEAEERVENNQASILSAMTKVIGKAGPSIGAQVAANLQTLRTALLNLLVQERQQVESDGKEVFDWGGRVNRWKDQTDNLLKPLEKTTTDLKKELDRYEKEDEWQKSEMEEQKYAIDALRELKTNYEKLRNLQERWVEADKRIIGCIDSAISAVRSNTMLGLPQSSARAYLANLEGLLATKEAEQRDKEKIAAKFGELFKQIKQEEEDVLKSGVRAAHFLRDFREKIRKAGTPV